MKRKHVLIPTVICFLLSVPPAMANETSGVRLMMQELTRTCSASPTPSPARTESRSDGPLIASHAQPPVSEKLRIARFLSAEMKRFKALDGETHRAARELEHAAGDKNGQQIVDAFSRLQMTCL